MINKTGHANDTVQIDHVEIINNILYEKNIKYNG